MGEGKALERTSTVPTVRVLLDKLRWRCEGPNSNNASSCANALTDD